MSKITLYSKGQNVPLGPFSTLGQPKKSNKRFCLLISGTSIELFCADRKVLIILVLDSDPEMNSVFSANFEITSCKDSLSFNYWNF